MKAQEKIASTTSSQWDALFARVTMIADYLDDRVKASQVVLRASKAGASSSSSGSEKKVKGKK